MNQNTTIAILGGDGFLGSALTQYFRGQGLVVTPINRENYADHENQNFDVFINANGNSKKFWANQNPEADYQASVVSVEKSLTDFKFKKYIYISSSDVYPHHGDPALSKEDQIIDATLLQPYGFHKYQAEQIVLSLSDFIIVRLSAMVGPGLVKGVVKDIQTGQEIFITASSRLQFISTDEVGRCLSILIDSNVQGQIINCGGKGNIKISQLAESLDKSLKVRSDAQEQLYNMDVTKLDAIAGLQTSAGYIQQFKSNNI